MRGPVSVWEAPSLCERPRLTLRGPVSLWEAPSLFERPRLSVRGPVSLWEALIWEAPSLCERSGLSVRVPTSLWNALPFCERPYIAVKGQASLRVARTFYGPASLWEARFLMDKTRQLSERYGMGNSWKANLSRKRKQNAEVVLSCNWVNQFRSTRYALFLANLNRNIRWLQLKFLTRFSSWHPLKIISLKLHISCIHQSKLFPNEIACIIFVEQTRRRSLPNNFENHYFSSTTFLWPIFIDYFLWILVWDNLVWF